VDAAVVIAQVPVHLLALENRHGAGRLAEPHRIDSDQALKICETVHQRKTDRSRIEAAHTTVRMMLLVVVEGMDAHAIVLQKIVTDPDDRDRFHAEAPRRKVY
jgi:hypothetical protein